MQHPCILVRMGGQSDEMSKKNAWMIKPRGGLYCTWMPVRHAITQGFILGPILSNFFINNVDEVVKSLLIRFADDTKLRGAVDLRKSRAAVQA